jgi:HD superfamily phosphohydrolase
MGSTTKQATGYFQTLEATSPSSILIHDELYGATTVTEPVLLELLRCPAVARLRDVCQHGITGLLGITPRITRLEHSIGAFLAVRRVGGSLEEQVVALLHDVSHTALSHVVDWAFSEPGKESFHEVHKDRYVATTELGAVLVRHGFVESEVFDEEKFRLVEMPSPHLCADRFDYGIRDAVAFGNLSLEDARKVVDSLVAYPDPESPERLLVLTDAEMAVRLARAYLASDKNVYSSPEQVAMYRTCGLLIGDAIRRGAIQDEQLWTLSDELFWETLCKAVDEEGRESLRQIETGTLPINENLPAGTKIRTLDPDVWDSSAGAPMPLSKHSPEYAQERLDYVQNRRAMLLLDAGV